MLSLRPHQQECHDAVIQSHKKGKRVISIQMATGSGKTRVLLALPSAMTHSRIVYVFPTLGLIRQFKDDYLDEFTHIFPRYVEASSNSSLTDSALKKVLSRKTYCVITTYDSLPKVLQFAINVDCVLFDEAHHADAPQCQQSMSEYEAKIKCVIRASATLNESDTPCFTYPFHQAVKDGVCRDYSTYCFIKKKGSEHELISYLEAHRKQTGNSKVMVFTTFTEAEKDGTTNVYQFMDKYRDTLTKTGGWMQGIVSSQSQDERQTTLKTFESNADDQLSLLVSCRTIGEGVDTKKANVVLFVDPIRSTIMIIQRIGRGTRVYRDKDGVPLPVQRDGSVIVGIYIDPAKYEGKTEQEIDQLLKENMSEKGDFSPIFCVLAALRATDPDTYYQCLHFQDRQKTHARIKEQGMDRIEVPRDGNCFFHCIGLQTGETHGQVRQQVVDYMEEHPENYADFLSDEDNVEALREEGEWDNDAMDVVVRATADMLGQTIRVHRPDGRIDDIGKGEEQMDVLLEGNHYTFLTHNDKVYDEEVEEKRAKSKSTAPKKRLFIDIDPDFGVSWKISGDLTKDFTARIDAEIENDGLTLEDRWKIKHGNMCEFIKGSDQDPKKRKRPSNRSTDIKQKQIGFWITSQKKNYDQRGPEFSRESMKNPELWDIWNKTLSDPEYREVLKDLDLIQKWKNRHKDMCKLIKDSNIDPKKRVRPSEDSKCKQTKTSGAWTSNQVKHYNNIFENSIGIMKNLEIWEIWTNTLSDPDYSEALRSKKPEDPVEAWKSRHKEMCTFIIKSNVDKKKRTAPSRYSKDKKENSLGEWTNTQKTKTYDPRGSTFSKNIMKNPEIWSIWTETLSDPEYSEALSPKKPDDPIEDWKSSHKKMCDLIIASNTDPKKRKTPSRGSDNEEEKSYGHWTNNQKENYDPRGVKFSKKIMENPDIWEIWTNTLSNTDFSEALKRKRAENPIESWKLTHKEMCTLIVKSNVNDNKKRTAPSQKSKVEVEKKSGQWIHTQKRNFNTEGHTSSKQIMNNPEIWDIWNKTLSDIEYSEALKNKPCGKNVKQSSEESNKPQPPPSLPVQPQEETCTAIFQSGINKGKACGKKNCGVHKKIVQKPMTHALSIPQLTHNPSSEQPRAPRPQSQLSLLHKEYKTLRSDNLATKFREHPQLWHEYHHIAEANEASFPDGQVPYQRVISFLKTYLATFHHKKQKTIVDMGCGTARVQRAFADRPNLTFHNLDHIACDERVTVADIAHTGLEDGDADVAILCLAMWGSNKEEYLTEAFRLLDPNGRLIIVEPSKRWMDEETGQHRLRDTLVRHGFTIVQEEVMTEEQQVHKFSLFVAKK